MIYHLLKQRIQLNPFNEVYLITKFDVSSSNNLRYINFQTGYLTDFEQFKVDSHSTDFGQIETDTTHLL